MSEKNKNESNKKSSDYLYKVDRVCGNGSFGIVFQAKVIQTGEVVAIKKVYQDRRYKNREYTLTKTLNHPNIIHLTHAFYTTGEKKDEIYLNLVMNYVSDNLNRINRTYIQKKEQFPIFLIKLYTFQIARALNYVHSKHICHRDIKPQNILIDPADYTLKLCDFGCAKHLVKTESNIAYICSRFYRPPELVLGATKYSTKVDVWSMGCVIAELVLNKPIFPGKSATDQLMEIMKVLGTPTKEQMKSMNGKNIKISKLPVINQKSWKDVFKGKNDDEVFMDLVGNLLVYEPQKRLGPYQALCHPYFNELKQKDVILPDNKKLPKHLFEFKECEINFDKESIQKLLSQIQK